MLNQQGLGLVVLSACQSSMYGVGEGEKNEELAAIGSVAARLTQTGVQSVLAMSYSVLVKTTEMLFGSFYGELVRGKGIGESLDNARRSLMQNPERGGRSRGQERIEMKLQDWFVPTLYQSGSDRGMVDPESPPAPNSGGAEPLEGMPEAPIAGFFGRRRELWAIERAFTPNLRERRKETRRVTIAGFGGQGKTALAVEAGRWLVQSGIFDTAVFVDYQAFQGMDAVSVAVSTMARDLGMNLIDGDAATVELGRRRTLVILDNLEDLGAEVQQALLTQAIAWSEAGQSRVLVTTRQDDLGHGRYGRSGFEYQLIELKGLGSVADPEDAIDYFQGLMAVPPMPAMLPGRKALIELFGKVDFHPLSIALVAGQLRTRGIVDVIQALDRLLAGVPAGQSKDRSLIASLNLSLDRLDGDARSVVGRLGVFQGGAFEDNLLAITELTTEQWTPLRRQLESAGLMRAESLEHVGVGVPFLKFHPTLARVLWASLGEAEQGALQQRHRERYYALADFLYFEDRINPYGARTIAQRELANFLVGVRGALSEREEWSVDFVAKVNLFLTCFGMNADIRELNQQAEIASQFMVVGSEAWFLARISKGKERWEVGYPQEAITIFQELLVALGEELSYERSLTLGCLGRCSRTLGRFEQAVKEYEQALMELAQLEGDEDVQREIGITQADLGDVLVDMGEYEAARQVYSAALLIAQAQHDTRQEATIQFQLGTLARQEGDLLRADTCYQSSLVIARNLNEPNLEATTYFNQGLLYQQTRQWERAENAYRAAAQINEVQGDLAAAASTWNQLAILYEYSGKPKEAEAWYRKAIAADKNPSMLAPRLSHLANLLQAQGNLPEARKLAEESLTLKQTLAPAAAEIWTTYDILADVATQQGEAAKAQDYRRLSRQSYAAFAGSRYALQKWEEGIQGVVAAIDDVEVRSALMEVLSSLVDRGYGNLVQAIQRIWDGVRDEDELCDGLGFEDGAIVVEILSRL